MSAEDLQPYVAELPEPVAHMYPSELEAFLTGETCAPAFSIPVVSPTHGWTVPLFTEAQLRTVLADAHAHYAAQVLPRAGLAQPAGDPAMPVVAWLHSVVHADSAEPDAALSFAPDNFPLQGLFRSTAQCALVRQSDAQAAIAARDALVAGLEADLRERDERIASMRTEHGQEVIDLKARIEELEAATIPTVDALEETIRSGLLCTYHCLRVWSAWSVGTMSEDDFEPVDESETPREIAECVWALFQADTPAAPQPKEPT